MPPKVPPPTRPRGRPPKPRRKKGRELQAAGGTPASTPSPPEVDALSPLDPSNGIPLEGDEARHAMLVANQNQARVSTVASGASHRLFLNAIHHREEDGWRLAQSMPIEDLAPWFDDLVNDFRVHAMHPKQDVPTDSLAVIVKWIGHPGSTPRDPRARQCFIRWNNPPPPQGLINVAIQKHQPVIRWDLRCAGVHDLDFSEPDASTKADEGKTKAELEVEEEDEDDDNLDAGGGRWKACSSLVKLHAEVYADDLSKVYVWQQNEHPDVAPEDRMKGLQFSRMQRSIFLERLRLHGLKVSSLVIETQQLSPAALGRTTALPLWRSATSKELASMYVAVKHRQLLDRNPWRATHLLVKRNPRKVYRYVPHDFSKPDSESAFTIGLTDDYSLDSGIAYSLNDGGLGSDQCWRNKSQNRAALSLLCTVDEGKHMVPVATFISANARAETLFQFFVGTYEKVVDRAKAITTDPSIITTRNRAPEIIEAIQDNAESIVSNGWQIAQVMIDKHYPSLLALKMFIQKYNLTLRIRICQFHVVRALLYWEWGDGRKGLAAVIPKAIKFHIIWLFRFVQRARTREEFDQLTPKFLAEVKKLFMDDDELGDDDEEDELEDDDVAAAMASQASKAPNPKHRSKGRRGKPKTPEVRQAMFDAVSEYFETAWFIDAWIDHFTDIGLPPNRGRDGTWNTNNWSESAFKTFDTVFLQSRQNKRIDRLGAIILNSFLPYYQYWRPADRRPPQGVIEMQHEEYTLWDQGAVKELGHDRYGVDVMVNGHAVRFEVTMNPMRCKCLDYGQTGKLCLHILVVQHLISNGPVGPWLEAEVGSETAIPKKPPTDPKRKKVKSDDAESAELYGVLNQLKDAEAEEEEEQVSASPEPAVGAHTGDATSFGICDGENPGSTAKCDAITRREEKPGRAPAGRLGPNSLFPGTLNTTGVRRRVTRLMNNEGDLTIDELEMNTANVTRWAPLEYELRAEEMSQWAAILNFSEIARRDGWLFVSCSPTCFPPAVMDSLDWSVPLTTEQLQSQRLESLAEIFEPRNNIELKHLVCFHLHAAHWTIFHHDLTATPTKIERLNSLGRPKAFKMPSTSEKDLGFSIEDQVLLSMYLHPGRLPGSDPSGKVPQIDSKSKAFTQPHLHLQRSDSTTCGFWAVFVVFSMLLGFDLKQEIVRGMDKTPTDLKEVLAPIYSAFRADDIGVPLDLVETLFQKFQPTFDYSALTEIWFSVRPQTIARAEIPAFNDFADSLDSDVALKRVTNPLLGDATWLVGSHRPSAANIRDLRDGKELHNAILDAYLDLFVRDTAASRIPVSKFHIVDSLIAKDMQDTPKNGSDIAGMSPQSRSKRERRFWFEDQACTDIFLLKWLLIPWFWSAHWMLVGVELETKNIYIYDSYKAKGGTKRGSAATERTLQMLRFEHLARYDSPLDAEWSATVQLLDVPQQGKTTLNCGLFTIWFTSEVVQGRTDTSQWSFTAADCEQERLKVLNRLCSAIHTDMQERNVEQLERGGFVHQGTDEKDLELGIATLDKSVADEVYPFLPSTDVDAGRRMAVKDWQIARDRRLTDVSIGSVLVFPPRANGDQAGPNGNKAYPAIVTEIREMIMLEWFEGIYDALPEGVARGFHVDKANTAAWEAVANMTFSLEQLARIEWPAQLTNSQAIFPSVLFPHQEHLANALYPWVIQLAAFFCGPQTDRPVDVWSYIEHCFLDSDDPHHFYREFLGCAPGQEPFCGADEAFFTTLGNQIQIHLHEFENIGVGRSRNDLSDWVRGVARCILATEAAAFYLHVDSVTAMKLLQQRRVRRPMGPHERVLEAYAHAVRQEPAGTGRRLVEEVLVVVPGIEVRFPCAV
ncbi:hypothetical protein K438DRAFT_1976392 [Mycena galopus ATCC 62051]|nr:hypothetical protein K438DRAFT_1976392 [Mycena galopus ATCC 62051]